MSPQIQTLNHHRHRIGHTLVSIGVLSFILISILINLLPPQNVKAFGLGEIADLSNAARLINGVSALKTNDYLMQAAQLKAEHMRENQYFEHTYTDGTTGWYFIKQQNYSYKSAGENLAATNEDASAVVNGWMNSAGHRANLLNSNYTEVGYGMVDYGNFQNYQNVVFIVALYAQPSSTASFIASANSEASSIMKSSDKTNSVIINSSESPSGTVTAFSTKSFNLNSNMLLLMALMSCVLVISGVVIELRSIFKVPGVIHVSHRHNYN